MDVRHVWTILVAAALAMYICPWLATKADVVAADASPSTVTLQVRVTAPGVIQLEPDELARARTVADILPPGTIVDVAPAMFSTTWSIFCEIPPPGGKPDSPQGIFIGGGATIATNPVVASVGTCAFLGDTFFEPVTIPAAVRQFIRSKLLALPLPRSFARLQEGEIEPALRGLIVNSAIAIDYQRIWTHDISITDPGVPGTVRLQIGLSLNAKIVLSRCELASVSVNNPPQALALARFSAVQVPLTWTLSTTCTGTGSPISALSDRLVFRTTSGGLLSQVLTTIRRTNLLFGTTVIQENVTIPPTLYLSALDAGSSSIVVERVFSDGTSRHVASTRVHFGTTGMQGFAVNRLALRYENGSRVRIVPERDFLRVLADISFTGAGLLQAEWDIAGPTGPGGVPLYRPLRLVRQFLIGSQRTTLTSPELPTDVPGMYFVRLRLTNPGPTGETPILRYFVGEFDRSSVLALRPDLTRPIRVHEPPNGTIIWPGLEFRWAPVPDADNYLLEFYQSRDISLTLEPADGSEPHSDLLVRGAPFTGIVVPGDRQTTRMSRLVADHLQPGIYWWRVIATNSEGIPVGAGPMRRVSVSAEAGTPGASSPQ